MDERHTHRKDRRHSILRKRKGPLMLLLLRNRNFFLLWLGQFVSLCGDWLLFIALPFYVYQLTGSILPTGIMLMAERLPRIVLGAIAGVFLGRCVRGWTMLISALLCA